MPVVGMVGRASLLELARDPLLTVACVLMIVVSCAWIVVARLIAREVKRQQRVARRASSRTSSSRSRARHPGPAKARRR